MAELHCIQASFTGANVCHKVVPEKVEFEVQQEMPGCCGVWLLGEAAGSGVSGDMTVAAMREALADQCRIASLRGLALYSITDSQEIEAEALEAEGFTPLAVFRNPNTGNRVRLYGKLLNQRKAPTKRRRR